jgi:D-arabinose 1-dehydrogenase-like Zn-dependent alcohol dehydrogenase
MGFLDTLAGYARLKKLLCAGITTFNALRNSGLRAGETVAVVGIQPGFASSTVLQ